MKKILTIAITMILCVLSSLPVIASPTELPIELTKHQQLFDKFNIDIAAYVEIDNRLNEKYGTEFRLGLDETLRFKQTLAKIEGLPDPTMGELLRDLPSPEEYEKGGLEHAVRISSSQSAANKARQDLLYSSDDNMPFSLSRATLPVTKTGTTALNHSTYGSSVNPIKCEISGNIELVDQQGFIWNSVTSGYAVGHNIHRTVGYQDSGYTWSPVDFKRSIEVRFIGDIIDLINMRMLASNVYTYSLFFVAQQ